METFFELVLLNEHFLRPNSMLKTNLASLLLYYLVLGRTAAIFFQNGVKIKFFNRSPCLFSDQDM
jgi:hypothetical protein